MVRLQLEAAKLRADVKELEALCCKVARGTRQITWTSEKTFVRWSKHGQSNVAEGLPCLVVDLHMASACQAISMEAERHRTICQACRRRMQIREIILELQLPIPCNTLQYIRWIQMYCLSFNVCSRVLPIMKEDWGNMGDYVDSKLIKKIR
jgi:hypothetical protein